MSSIFYALIILPIIYFVLIGFVDGSFTGGVTSLNNQFFLMNCPLPLENQNVNGSAPTTFISNNALYYVPLQPNQLVGNSTNVGTFFYCSIVTPPASGTQSVIITTRNYGQTVASFPVGWFSYVGDTIGSAFGKIIIGLQIAYTFFTTPADMSGIVWFNLMAVLLLLMFATGVGMIVRGSG